VSAEEPKAGRTGLISRLAVQSSLPDQETGVRGYALTGDDSFLDPVSTGKRHARTWSFST
jgi:CHASE3 domain sensor protein